MSWSTLNPESFHCETIKLWINIELLLLLIKNGSDKSNIGLFFILATEKIGVTKYVFPSVIDNTNFFISKNVKDSNVWYLTFEDVSTFTVDGIAFKNVIFVIDKFVIDFLIYKNL